MTDKEVGKTTKPSLRQIRVQSAASSLEQLAAFIVAIGEGRGPKEHATAACGRMSRAATISRQRLMIEISDTARVK